MMKPTLSDEPTRPAEVLFNVAYSGGKVLLPDWDNPVVIDLTTVSVHDNLPILLYHNGTRRVGFCTEYVTEPDHLSLKGSIVRSLPDSQIVLAVHNDGGSWECSIGTGPVPEENITFIESGDLYVNEQRIEAPFYLLQRVEIREISFVCAGADSSTQVEIRASLLSIERDKSMEFDSNSNEFRAYLSELGINWDTLDEGNRGNLAAAYQLKNEAAQTVEAEAETTPVEEEKKEEEEEKKEVQASALTAAKRRVSSLTSVNRPSNARPSEARIIEASLLMAGGANGTAVERAGYTQAEINEAASREYRNIGLHGLMRRAVTASGLYLPNDCTARELVRSYHDAVQASGLSTRDFSPTGIMSNVADKMLRIQADQLSTVADKIFYKRSVKTFNKVVSGKLNMLGDIPEVAPGEDFSNVGLADNAQDYAITKKGVNLTVTLEDQVNDDLGSFERALQQFGRLFANSIDKAAIGALVEQSPTLFTGNQKKALTFSAANLKTVCGAFARIKDVNGEYRNLVPGAILTGPEIATEARALFIFNDKGSIAPQTSTEVLTAAYNVLSTPYIAATGGWYLLPRDEYVGEIAFLNGNSSPTVEQACLNTRNLNIEFLVWGTSGVLVYNDAPVIWSCPA